MRAVSIFVGQDGSLKLRMTHQLMIGLLFLKTGRLYFFSSKNSFWDTAPTRTRQPSRTVSVSVYKLAYEMYVRGGVSEMQLLFSDRRTEAVQDGSSATKEKPR